MYKQFTIKRFAFAAGAIAAAVMLPAASAHADVKAGILTCQVEGGASYVIGSTKKLSCVYTPDGAHVTDRYVGQIKKWGVDVGVTGKAAMAWVVLAPTAKLGHGALTGMYDGAAVNASVVVGGGANVLIGGSNKTISLQPVSLQGQTGLNAAVTVASLKLRSVK